MPMENEPLLYQNYVEEIRGRGFDRVRCFEPGTPGPGFQLASLAIAVMGSDGQTKAIELVNAFAWCLRDLQEERARNRNLAAALGDTTELAKTGSI